MTVGGIILIISSYLITLFGMNTSYLFEVFPLSLFGLGVGCIMQNTVLITQQCAEKKCNYIYIIIIIITLLHIIYYYIKYKQ